MNRTDLYDNVTIAPADEQLAEITTLAEQLITRQAEVEHLERELEQAKERETLLRSVTIPEAMAKVGMVEFTLSNGAKVHVEKVYYAGLPSGDERMADRIAAFTWLRDNNHEGLIKTLVNCNFSREQQDQVKKVDKLLTEAGVPHMIKDDIHWQTLRSWVREMIEGGKEFPHELFGAYVGNTTKVIQPKKK